MNKRLSSRIEAILFTCDEPINSKTLACTLEVDLPAVESALLELAARYEQSAMQLQNLKTGWRLQLRPEYFPEVQAFSQTTPPRYSRAFWETLAYIAYHQPVTRSEIDAVRGVSTNSSIYRQLFDLEWITVIGNKESTGRAELLATTEQFLNDFSVASLQDLPAFPEDTNELREQ